MERALKIEGLARTDKYQPQHLSLIVDNLAAGATDDEILDGYPSLTKEDIRVALAYAAEMARERYVDIPLKPAT